MGIGFCYLEILKKSKKMEAQKRMQLQIPGMPFFNKIVLPFILIVVI